MEDFKKFIESGGKEGAATEPEPEINSVDDLPEGDEDMPEGEEPSEIPEKEL